MKNKLKTPAWEPGQEVEFKHVAELSSRLSVRDAGIVGTIWNQLTMVERPRVRELEQELSELRVIRQLDKVRRRGGA